MDRRVTPWPSRVTSPTWGPPPPCKQALSVSNNMISSAIWNKWARVKFSTTTISHEPVGEEQFVVFEKFTSAYYAKLQEKSSSYLLLK